MLDQTVQMIALQLEAQSMLFLGPAARISE